MSDDDDYSQFMIEENNEDDARWNRKLKVIFRMFSEMYDRDHKMADKTRLLLATFPEYNIFKKYSPKTIHSPFIQNTNHVYNKDLIVKFDDFYIVSKEENYYIGDLIYGHSTFKTGFSGADVGSNNFVILQYEYTDDKIKEIVEFQHYLQTPYDSKCHTLEFKHASSVWEISKCVGQTIYLFFASSKLTLENQQYIDSHASMWFEKHNIRVGYMVPEEGVYDGFVSLKWFGSGGEMLEVDRNAFQTPDDSCESA
jgi:hypothetical protein